MISYSRAEIQDFLAIAKLDREAWDLDRNAQYIPDGEHAWRLWVEHALVMKAEYSGEITGAILAFPCSSGAWCIHKVFVRWDQRARGIGSKLLEVLLVEIDKIGVDCFLTVDPANTRAVRLYRKWGFTEEEFVEGYYRQNEDRLVLTRRAEFV